MEVWQELENTVKKIKMAQQRVTKKKGWFGLNEECGLGINYITQSMKKVLRFPENIF